jgi:glycosyltransferase involved in cell wall biosynthesis
VDLGFQANLMKESAQIPSSESASPPVVFLMTNTLETGGSERQFVTLANALDRNKFPVNLGCLKRIGPFVNEVSDLSEFSPGGSLFGSRSWQARVALARFLRKNNVAVAHSFDFYSNLMLIPAARFAGVPVVLGSHRQLGDLLTRRQFRIQNAAFRLCDRVVCNSLAAAGRLQSERLNQQKLIVIGNGLPAELFAKAVPVLPRDPEVVTIGMISRINHREKKHEMLIRVAAKLVPQFPRLRFVFAGDGALRAGLEEMVGQLGLSSNFIFLGDRRDVPAVLASLDISVLPSSSESLSNVILESMAAGVPAVAADVGGNPELVQNGKNGFLFPEGNEDRFAAALQTLITQPELRKQFGTRARELAVSQYSISRIRDQYQELYTSQLAAKSPKTHPALALQATSTGKQGSLR